MTQSIQIANLKKLPDSLWKQILELADENAAFSVCKVLKACQDSLINRLWRSFNCDQFPFINAWLTQNTFFGNRPQVVENRPVVSGRHLTRLHQLLTSELQRPPKPVHRPIHPVSFQALENETN